MEREDQVVAMRNVVHIGLDEAVEERVCAMEIDDLPTPSVTSYQLTCPRLLLSWRSAYFKGLFNSGMSDSNTQTVVVPRISDASILQSLITFILSDRPPVFSSSNFAPIYYAADILHLPFLKV